MHWEVNHKWGATCWDETWHNILHRNRVGRGFKIQLSAQLGFSKFLLQVAIQNGPNLNFLVQLNCQ